MKWGIDGEVEYEPLHVGVWELSNPVNPGWTVNGIQHREEGPILVEYPREQSTETLYYLYGDVVTEQDFKEIKAEQAKRNLPFWVAYLVQQEYVDYHTQIKDISNWDELYSLPVSWLLKIWDITFDNGPWEWDAFLSVLEYQFSKGQS